MYGCLSQNANQEEAWDKCEKVLGKSITKQIDSPREAPRLVEAIPTLGKTTAAGKVAPALCHVPGVEGFTYLTHLRRNRESFLDILDEEVQESTSIEYEQLPVFNEDCPTAAGKNGSEAEDRINGLYSRGIAPGVLHTNERFDFPCGGNECQYMQQWQGILDADILVGHPTHAYESRVVEDRVVIVDEGVGSSFETDFSAEEWRRAIKQFLKYRDDVPADSIRDILTLRRGENPERRDTAVSAIRSVEQSDIYEHLLESNHGHVDGLYALWGWIEFVSPESEKPPYKMELRNGVEFAKLADNKVTVYDPESGMISVRRTPDFAEAAALVGLDGTPTKSMWEGRLGLDELEVEQVLCRDCRKRYLSEILGYDIIQTTQYRKSYSRTDDGRINFAKDRGLLHEVCQRFPERVGLITTKSAKEPLLDHEDQNTVSINRFNTDHYGNIRSSNRFEGSNVAVGVVIGSPHPGTDTLRRVAGLDGVSYEFESRKTSTNEHHYRHQVSTNGQRYIEHYRDHRVAQAIFRFGRRDGATVFVHTALFPDWMREIAQQCEVDKRSAGERMVWEAIQRINRGTTKDFNEEINELGSSRIRGILSQFAKEGIVEKCGTPHKFVWERTDYDNFSTARLTDTDGNPLFPVEK